MLLPSCQRSRLVPPPESTTRHRARRHTTGDSQPPIAVLVSVAATLMTCPAAVLWTFLACVSGAGNPVVARFPWLPLLFIAASLAVLFLGLTGAVAASIQAARERTLRGLPRLLLGINSGILLVTFGLLLAGLVPI